MRWFPLLAALALTACMSQQSAVMSRVSPTASAPVGRLWLVDRIDERSGRRASDGLRATLPGLLAGCGAVLASNRIDTWGVSDLPDAPAALQRFQPDLVLVVELTQAQINQARHTYSFRLIGRDRQARQVWDMEWRTTGPAADSSRLGGQLAEVIRSQMVQDRLLACDGAAPANPKSPEG